MWLLVEACATHHRSIPYRFLWLAGWSALLFLSLRPVSVAGGDTIPSEGELLFVDQVAPVLTQKCLACHRTGKSEAGFDLSSRAALLDSGLVNVDDAEESWMVSLIRHVEEPQMPLEGARLDDDEIEAIVRWISLGAPYTEPLHYDDPNAQHWSFERLKKVSPPDVDDDWVSGDIDRFIRAAQRENGLAASGPVGKRPLIRRLYFDLIGLPPSDEEIAEFEADERPDAYQRRVDQLLNSPRYGEHWGRHWLDLARYADSNGYRFDDEQAAAYHYRDFVIQALNEDMPYDQFVRWQIAGDELAPDDVRAITATGFLAVGPRERDEGTPLNILMTRHDELDDLVNTTSTAMLGLTLSCARCHDHKFDSLSQREYYQFFHVFNSGERRVIDVDRPEYLGTAGDAKEHRRALVYAENANKPKQTHLLIRGNSEAHGDEMSLGFIDLLTLGREPADWLPGERPAGNTSYQRAAMANWMTDPEHGAGHLLARVMANRLWYYHFGEGLVRTPSDFGVQGDRPELPELLDWLAGSLISQGWRLKPLHRKLVLSSVYRQSSRYDTEKAAIDPENRTWWRRVPIRLTAEQFRDSILTVSGALNDSMYGPGVKVPIPRESIITRAQAAYPQNITENYGVWRRSVYVFTKRTTPVPLIQLFDGADTSVSCGRRTSTTVPTQSLVLMNNDFIRVHSKNLSQRVVEKAHQTAQPAWHVAFRMAMGREPTASEQTKLNEFIERQLVLRPMSESDVLTDLCQVLFSSNEFIYID